MKKEDFAHTLMEFDKHMPKGLTECEEYGMTWGCDKDCPVFQRGECELQEENEKLFNKVVE